MFEPLKTLYVHRKLLNTEEFFELGPEIFEEIDDDINVSETIEVNNTIMSFSTFLGSL